MSPMLDAGKFKLKYSLLELLETHCCTGKRVVNQSVVSFTEIPSIFSHEVLNICHFYGTHKINSILVHCHHSFLID